MSTSNPTAAEVNQAYQDFLGRPADVGGLDWYLSSGKSLDEIKADLAYVGGTTVEQPTYGATSTEYIDPFAQYYQAPSAQENQFIAQRTTSQLAPRQDINYDELFTARPLTGGGNAPTATSINEAFETFFGRPADVPGIQGYLNSGKSIEQIRADLAYQALYAPETTLAPNAQYYEAPSTQQAEYISRLGGGVGVGQQPDTFTYGGFTPLDANQVRSLYTQKLGYEPTEADIEYWTRIYPMSPDVRMSPNPAQQTVNAILAASNLPQYKFLQQGVDLTGTRGVDFGGSRPAPTVFQPAPYTDYGAPQATEQPAETPFGGFFDQGFDPFDYTGIAPTPLTYTGYAPVSVPPFQGAYADLAPLPPVEAASTETGGDEGIAAIPT